MKNTGALVITNALYLAFLGIITASVGCAGVHTIPPKVIPSYEFSISSPEVTKNGGSISALPGETVVLPLTIHSDANVPLTVGVILPDNPVPLPDFITVHIISEYKTLLPSQNVTVEIAYVVTREAKPGIYQTAISCEIKHPVPNRGDKPTYSFQIKVN